MKDLIFSVPFRPKKPCRNGSYHLVHGLKIAVPDVPVGRVFIREKDKLALVVKSWDYSDDTYVIRTVRENDIEEFNNVAAADLILKLGSDNWKIKTIEINRIFTIK